MISSSAEPFSNPIVSVLVAVYNSADYLLPCLESLRQQTLRQIQVICVDDASTDESWNILNHFSKEDSRFEVIHLEVNGGQAHARNVALKQVRGRYVAFLDSDDFLSADALQASVNVFEHYVETDCVLFSLVKFGEKDGKCREENYPLPQFDVMSGREAFKRSLNWEVHGVYVARKALYDQVPFDDSCRTYSDDNTTRLHYYLSREVRPCKGRYYYRQHPSSVTHQISVRRFDYLKACESMKRQLMALNVGQDILNFYENQRWLVLIDTCLFYYNHHDQLSEKDKRYGRQELKRIWKNIERFRLTPRLRHKFGYSPMPAWWFFRTEEWCYFTLRKIIWKGKK